MTLFELQAIQEHRSHVIERLNTMHRTSYHLSQMEEALKERDELKAKINRLNNLDLGLPLPEEWRKNIA